jgi:3-oxoacyl-[acyl-carrier-protein] synthase-3
MARRIAAKITGVAGYVPPRVMSNAEMEKLVDTDDAWIRERTGIRERHVVDQGVATSDLATAAAKELLGPQKSCSNPATCPRTKSI